MALLEYKCPNCTGAINFDPGTQEMVCPYCESRIRVDVFQAMDSGLTDDQKTEAIDWGYEGMQWRDGEQNGMAIYSCRSCAGEIVGDETLGSTSCPFCNNRIVITSKFSGTLRPDVVIPFKLGKDAAVKALSNHYLGKKLLPKVFKNKNHIDEVKGVYVPFWLFDAEVDAHIEYNAKKIRTWRDNTYDYTETSTYRAIRRGGIGFANVPADGSKAMDDTMMESIEPYHIEEAVGFQTAYLAGYFANKYDVDAKQSAPRANARIKASSEAAFASTLSQYNSVSAVRTDIHQKSGSVKYALLPVWLLTTSWKDKMYTFAMNGQTGEFVGDLPLDKSLLMRWRLGLFLGIGAAFPAVMALIWTIQGVWL